MRKYVIGLIASFVLVPVSLLFTVFYMWESTVSTGEWYDIYVNLCYVSAISFVLFVLLFLFCLVKIIMRAFKKPSQDNTPDSMPEN